MAVAEEAIEPRWWGRHLHELRWQAELGRLLVDPVYRGHGVPRGDGAPVLLIPGFLAGDGSLTVLSEWLRPDGPPPAPLRHPHQRRLLQPLPDGARAPARARGLQQRAQGRDHRPQPRRALRQGARAPPPGPRLPRRLDGRRAGHAVRDLGADAGAVAAVRAVHAVTTDRRERRGCFTSGCGCEFSQHYRAEFPADIPLTSIFSKGDGVVRWQACVVPYAQVRRGHRQPHRPGVQPQGLSRHRAGPEALGHRPHFLLGRRRARRRPGPPRRPPRPACTPATPARAPRPPWPSGGRSRGAGSRSRPRRSAAPWRRASCARPGTP